MHAASDSARMALVLCMFECGRTNRFLIGCKLGTIRLLTTVPKFLILGMSERGSSQKAGTETEIACFFRTACIFGESEATDRMVPL